MHPETHLTIYQRHMVDLERRLRRHASAAARGPAAPRRPGRALGSVHLPLPGLHLPDLHRRRARG